MSDDWTPTTLVVRGHYAWKSESIAAASSYIAGGEQFDRWLSEHDAMVKAEARESAHDEVFTNLADQGWDVSMGDDPETGVSILVQWVGPGAQPSSEATT